MNAKTALTCILWQFELVETVSRSVIQRTNVASWGFSRPRDHALLGLVDEVHRNVERAFVNANGRVLPGDVLLLGAVGLRAHPLERGEHRGVNPRDDIFVKF